MILTGNWGGETALQVDWGGSLIACDWIDNEHAHVAVPAGTAGTSVSVAVVTPVGTSNALLYTYDTSYSAAVFADNPVAYWQLQDAAGTTAVDATGNGHDGTIVGGVTLGAAGPLSGGSSTAMLFNGSTGKITVAALTGLPSGSSPYTLEAFVYWPSAAGTNGIVGYGNYGSASQVNALGSNGSGTLRNYWWANDLSLAATLSTGAWHHVAATFDGTTRTIYLDGVSIGSDTPGSPSIALTNVTIGVTNSTEWMNGRLAQVAIYATALSATRIAAHYAAL